MGRHLVLPVIVIVVLVSAASALATISGARRDHVIDSYCSPTGDYCTSVLKHGGGIKLRIATSSFSGHYRLCVEGRAKVCHNYVVKRHRGDAFYSDGIYWARVYPHRLSGRHRVSWYRRGVRLGPRLSFHWAGRS